MNDTQKTYSDAIDELIAVFDRAFKPVIKALHTLAPLLKIASIYNDLDGIIEKVYQNNSIEFMFDSKKIKEELIAELMKYITANDSKTSKK